MIKIKKMTHELQIVIALLKLKLIYARASQNLAGSTKVHPIDNPKLPPKTGKSDSVSLISVNKLTSWREFHVYGVPSDCLSTSKQRGPDLITFVSQSSSKTYTLTQNENFTLYFSE